MVQVTVMPTVRTSAWFSHSESVLQVWDGFLTLVQFQYLSFQTMLCSEDSKEREFAVSKILAIRGDQELGDKSVRLRQLPYLNLEAAKLEDLINWEGVTEPLTTCNLSKEKLEELKAVPLKTAYYPCHTQVIERAVKEVMYLHPASENRYQMLDFR